MKSTAKFFPIHHEHSKKVVINGERPSPLMVNKDSHLIRKSSKSYNTQRNPIIIYTKSPKVIHTKPHDFMALVQSLTGMAPRSNHQQEIFEDYRNSGSFLSEESNSSSIKKEHGSCAGDETSSVLKGSETCVKEEPFVLSNLFSFADMPLFTPNFSDSTRSVFKYSESPYGILGSLLSPSGLEFMKELPEY
ncbi:VQ motif-containing protein 8, chloroplastic-like [Lotus japonicus]|uniref:VQ motif-containing protein 8, chloroplastic-like n=1 Tax=Lotus japonicus TaxID=34305 RepID=UPI0025873166|nr:VQ motif-containing protein 8, chloroplastic-like [Lotus japonicus]